MRVFEFRNGLSSGKNRIFNGTVFSSQFVRAALVAAASIAAAAPAGAAVYWTDDDPMMPREIMVPEAQPMPRAKKPKRTGVKLEKALKENAKPVGPLVIAISIERQSMRVYDANGLFAESPVSTGVRGHSTPMGVFSVIQKNKWHRSNIYSGAPMPYMQRITWSGIALHAGVVPGHPASHGCIRMPTAFAIKMWGWTRMGSRVIITPGEISPTDFAHPLLLAQKPAPAPTPVAAIDAKDIVTTPKADKVDAKPADLGLKSSDAGSRTQTADASNAPVTPSAQASTPVAAAKPDSGALMTRRDVDDAVAKSVELPATDVKPASTMAEVPVKSEVAVEPAKIEPAKPSPAPAEPARKDETRPLDAAKAEMLPPAAEAPPKRNGQIAVLISARDNKLYVRQNFAPLFETPITIKPSERPLGTHVFTARLDRTDAKTFHWSAVSMPSAPRRTDDEDRASRRHKSIGAIEVKGKPLPDSAAEALDRVTIPADAATQIADALSTGGSIIVSDQGIAAGGETGQGTEFVVPLR